MVPMRVNLNADGALAHLDMDTVITPDPNAGLDVLVLPHGTENGLPSVGLLIKLPDGKHVLMQTTAQLFVAAARMIAARYPELEKV